MASVVKNELVRSMLFQSIQILLPINRVEAMLRNDKKITPLTEAIRKSCKELWTGLYL